MFSLFYHPSSPRNPPLGFGGLWRLTFEDVKPAKDMEFTGTPYTAVYKTFDGLEVLSPAREYRNRHASILLAFAATLEAMDEALRADCA